MSIGIASLQLGLSGSGYSGPATQVSAPQFSPAAGSYGPTQNVTITSATVGATIRYTTDGSTPTNSVGTVYSTPVAIASTTTLKAIAYNGVLTDSAVTTGVYTINGAVATPTFSPAAGNQPAAFDATISTATGGATLYYTTNGTDPTTGSTLYSGPVNISTALTLKALGVKAGFSDSAIGSAAYTINAGPPLTNLAAWYKKGTGQTDAGGGACSAWADQSGNGFNMVQATGANQPAIQGDGTLLFDGTSDRLTATGLAGLSQPFTIYFRVKQISWTGNDMLWAADSQTIFSRQIGSSPAIALADGSNSLSSSSLALSTWGSIAQVANGGSSSMRVGANSPVTGSMTGSIGIGLSLCSYGASGLNGNFQIAEVLVYNVAHNSTQQDTVIAYLDGVI